MDTYNETEITRKLDSGELQLQLWDCGRKQYVPVSPSTERGKAWRMCKPDRPTKNPKHRPPSCRTSGRSIDDVRNEYLAWALKAGISTITDWANRGLTKQRTAEGLPVHTRLVDPDTYFSVTEEHEEQHFATPHHISSDNPEFGLANDGRLVRLRESEEIYA